MEYLCTSQYAESGSVDGNATGNDFQDEMMNFGDEPVVPSIKLQKKGTTETVTLAISEVETWDNLLNALKKHFSHSDAEPQITSFDGNLISSAENYKANLRPGLHLIVYFPPTINEVSQSLGALFMTELSPGPHFVLMPDSESPYNPQLASCISPSSKLMYPSPGTLRRYHLQPPTIYFTVSTPIPINITLSNSAFKKTINPNEEYKHSKDPIGLSTQDSHHITPLFQARNYQGDSADYTTMRRTSNLPVKPPPTHSTPPWISPWGQFPIYSQVNGGHSTHGIVSGAYFPMTAFDLFAQSQRKKAICSIGWDVIAFPEGGLEDIVSGRIVPNISWTVKDRDSNQQTYNRTSEMRIYGNFECSMDNKDSQNAGWWMVDPEKLPTGFSGEAGEHSFLLKSVVELATYLNAFMKRCGIGEDTIRAFGNYWVQNLELSRPVEPRDGDFANTMSDDDTTSSSASTPKLILLKFLHPRELQNLLPITFFPEPHSIVRLFAVFRVIEAQEIEMEGIDAYGDFEMEVSRVMGGIRSCGGGIKCGHGGIKVAEVGGVRVFGGRDG